MKRLIVGLLLAMVGTASAQETKRPFDPVNEFSAFAEYSNDSSHILIGRSENRKLAAVGVSYARRLEGNRFLSWRWNIDVRPVVLLRNPFLTDNIDIEYLPGATPVEGLPPGTSHGAFLYPRNCSTFSETDPIYPDDSPSGTPSIGTYSYSQTCTHPWTYGGAISPIGQTVNFVPSHRLQPYVAANGGFVAFSKVTPSNDSTMFNFSFEVGIGFEYYLKAKRAISVDYRYHHISNAYRGVENPGVDSGVIKVAYLFGR